MTRNIVRATALIALVAFPLAGVSTPVRGEFSHSKIEELIQVAGPGMPTPVLQRPDSEQSPGLSA